MNSELKKILERQPMLECDQCKFYPCKTVPLASSLCPAEVETLQKAIEDKFILTEKEVKDAKTN
jgi:hypothetical protein